MLPFIALPLAFAVLAASPPAAAQTRLGDLLDSGAKRLSADEFRQHIVQRPIQGPLDSGLQAEIVFTPQGSLEGAGSPGRGYRAEWGVEIRGSWSVGPDDAVCTTIVLDGPTIRANFPKHCQFWFRLGDRYFVATSASDRRVRVLGRTVRE